MSSGRRVILFAVLAAIGFVSGATLTAGAGHLVGCALTTTPDGWGMWNGNSDPNHCVAGSGKDDVYGRGSSDELFGETGRDILRGYGGDDELKDGQGDNAGDTDSACMNNGADYVNFEDLDGKDDINDIPYPDGSIDTYDKNRYDAYKQIADDVSGGNGCPYAFYQFGE